MYYTVSVRRCKTKGFEKVLKLREKQSKNLVKNQRDRFTLSSFGTQPNTLSLNLHSKKLRGVKFMSELNLVWKNSIEKEQACRLIEEQKKTNDRLIKTTRQLEIKLIVAEAFNDRLIKEKEELNRKLKEI